MNPVIELAPDIWDAFAESCERWGGVGAGRNFADPGQETIPMCLIGHALSIARAREASGWAAGNEAERLTKPFEDREGFVGRDNDAAVTALAGQDAYALRKRVSWEAYCIHRNIVRGSAQ